MILAGDIGGTTTRLALFQMEDGRPFPRIHTDYPSKKYPGLEGIVSEFLGQNPTALEGACFGIAGPVNRGRVETPNLSWVVDGAHLAHEIGVKEVFLLNDLEATAYGIASLSELDFAILNEGSPNASGNRAVIAAGTGLGEAGLFWNGRSHLPFASEGGHTDFGPRDEVEAELLATLIRRFGHVSYERVVSGPGLFNLYQFLRDTGRGEEPGWLAKKLGEGDPSALIAGTAMDESSELCALALDRFVSLYGAEAGNLALKFLALGGVYVGGGIAPKILAKLKGPAFLNSFVDKGRYRKLLEGVPVRVILNDKTALLGAGRFAAMKCGWIQE
jgi:glucokinase